MKRNLSLLAIAAMVAVGGSAATLSSAASVDAASITNNAKSQKTTLMSFTYNGTTFKLPSVSFDNNSFVPAKALGDRLGFSTVWDAKAKTLTLSQKNKKLILHTDSEKYTLYGQEVPYGAISPKIVKSQVYVPLRFVAGKLGYRIQLDAKTKAIAVRAVAENDIAITTQELADEQPETSISIQYPVIGKLSNEAARTKINAFLAKIGQTYWKEAQDIIVTDPEEEYGPTKDNPWSYSMDYTVTSNENNRLSLYFTAYTYSGGAHGGAWLEPYTFDLTTGELISLKDIAQNPDYVSIINKAIKKEIKAQELPELVPFETIEEDRPYYLENDAVVITFQQYEYTPYAAGMPEFRIPLSSFKK